jgi:predicted methyltransferase
VADKAEKVTTPANGSTPVAGHPNVIAVSTAPTEMILPRKADVIWIRQNYHDLYDPFMGPVDVPAFNKAVYRALKPGGRSSSSTMWRPKAQNLPRPTRHIGSTLLW